MRMALAEAVEADELQGVLRLGAALVLGDAAQRQRKLDVLFRRQPGKQARLPETPRRPGSDRARGIGAPLMVMVPDVCWRRPAIIIRSVDLPQPLGPTSTTKRPA